MLDDSAQLLRARDEVVRRFAGLADPAIVATEFDALVAEFDDVPIRTYIPVLAERALRSRLGTQRGPTGA